MYPDWRDYHKAQVRGGQGDMETEKFCVATMEQNAPTGPTLNDDNRTILMDTDSPASSQIPPSAPSQEESTCATTPNTQTENDDWTTVRRQKGHRREKRQQRYFKNAELTESIFGPPKPYFEKIINLEFIGTHIGNNVDVVRAKREIIEAIGQYERLEKSNRSTLLIETKSQQQTDKLMKLETVAGFKVKAAGNEKLNRVRGVVRSTAMTNTSEEDLLEELREQGVHSLRRHIVKKNGTEEPTNMYFVTFNLHTRPSHLNLVWERIRVDEYKEKPIRCNKCQRFGHVAKYCRRNLLTCARCSEDGHAFKECNNATKCIHCEGTHYASDKKCPKYLIECEILSTQINNKTSRMIAYRTVLATHPDGERLYSQALSSNQLQPLPNSQLTQEKSAPSTSQTPNTQYQTQTIPQPHPQQATSPASQQTIHPHTYHGGRGGFVSSRTRTSGQQERPTVTDAEMAQAIGMSEEDASVSDMPQPSPQQNLSELANTRVLTDSSCTLGEPMSCDPPTQPTSQITEKLSQRPSPTRQEPMQVDPKPTASGSSTTQKPRSPRPPNRSASRSRSRSSSRTTAANKRSATGDSQGGLDSTTKRRTTSPSSTEEHSKYEAAGGSQGNLEPTAGTDCSHHYTALSKGSKYAKLEYDDHPRGDPSQRSRTGSFSTNKTSKGETADITRFCKGRQSESRARSASSLTHPGGYTGPVNPETQSGGEPEAAPLQPQSGKQAEPAIDSAKTRTAQQIQVHVSSRQGP